MLAVGLALGITGLLIVIGIIVATVRFRRGKNADGLLEDLPAHRATVMDRNHLASRITPYGTVDGSRTAPPSVFSYLPGANMRVAKRNSDGGWTFSDPTPITPPPPVLSPTSNTRRHPKEIEAYGASWAKYQRREDGLDALGYDPLMETTPPPAYGHPPN